MTDPFRRFRVALKRRESRVITSFYLKPDDGGDIWPYRPGQFLTLRIPTTGGLVLRTYSLSTADTKTRMHRISVKREDQGIGSGWLHDRVAEGDVIEVAAPRGGFVLDEGSTRPVLLLAGGVGVTPLLAMLHRLAATDRKVWFIQAAEDGDVHALRDEVAGLAAAAAGRIVARSVYQSPTDQDRVARRFDAEGFISRELLQSLLPLDDYDVYLCGPSPFMVAMWRLLTGLGVAPDRIAYEFFGKGGSLARLAEEPAASKPAPASVLPVHAPKSLARLEHITDPDARAVPDVLPAAKGPKPATNGAAVDQVVFARSGVTAAWDGSPASILDLAEAAGLDPDFSCREGICNTCMSSIQEGNVEYVRAPLDPPPPGKVLICCTRPVGRVVLNL